MNTVSLALRQSWSGWCRFWFESNQPEVMKTFRRLFAGLMLVFFILRTPDLMDFFSDSGYLPSDRIRDAMELGYRQSIFFYFHSDAAIWLGHGLLLASTLSLLLGFKPRISALVAYVLHVSFLHRNMTPAYGIDSISIFFFLNLTLASEKRESRLGSIALRLMQIQVCIIYFYSGLEKLKGTHWWYGDAIWRVLANHQLASADFTWVAHFPLVVVLSTWSSLLWETYFPVLIWLPRTRIWVLLFGVAMHLGIALSMSIPFFGFLMIISYVTFLTEAELTKVFAVQRTFLQQVCKKRLKSRTLPPKR